jgi:hypothetical protein
MMALTEFEVPTEKLQDFDCLAYVGSWVQIDLFNSFVLPVLSPESHH